MIVNVKACTTVKSKFVELLIFFNIFFFSFSGIGNASAISPEQAGEAAYNWLLENPNPFGEKMGDNIREILSYKGDKAGNIGYYLVILDPNGQGDSIYF
jgi:hypothetical protein